MQALGHAEHAQPTSIDVNQSHAQTAGGLQAIIPAGRHARQWLKG